MLSYIRTARASKVPDVQIESTLFQQGWRQGDINEAMMTVDKTPISTPSPQQNNTIPSSTPITQRYKSKVTLPHITVFISDKNPLQAQVFNAILNTITIDANI